MLLREFTGECGKGERSWEAKLYTSGRLREVASRVKLPETPQLVERRKTTALQQGSNSSNTMAAQMITLMGKMMVFVVVVVSN